MDRRSFFGAALLAPLFWGLGLEDSEAHSLENHKAVFLKDLRDLVDDSGPRRRIFTDAELRAYVDMALVEANVCSAPDCLEWVWEDILTDPALRSWALWGGTYFAARTFCFQKGAQEADKELYEFYESLRDRSENIFDTLQEEVFVWVDPK